MLMSGHVDQRRLLRPAAFVWTGLCELFELQLLSTFVAFGGLSLAELDTERPKVRTAHDQSQHLQDSILKRHLADDH